MTDIRKKTSYTLQFPVEFEGNTITELQFRRIKGKDIRNIEKQGNDIDKTAYAIGHLSGFAPALFDELDATDIDGISELIEGFMNRKAAKTV